MAHWGAFAARRWRSQFGDPDEMGTDPTHDATQFGLDWCGFKKHIIPWDFGPSSFHITFFMDFLSEAAGYQRLNLGQPAGICITSQEH